MHIRYQLPEDRICKVCNIQPETEEHFILYCPKYQKIRLDMFKEVYKYEPDIFSMSHSKRFVYLMCNENINIIKCVMTFLVSAYKERSFHLGGEKKSKC